MPAADRRFVDAVCQALEEAERAEGPAAPGRGGVMSNKAADNRARQVTEHYNRAIIYG
jgi:hypothetical protein